MNPLSAAPVSASTRWIATLVLAITAAVLLVGPGHAQAKTTVSGKATFTLGTGKAGKALKRQNVRITRVAPARVKRLAGKRFRVVAPVSGVSTKPARTRLKGGFSFRRGKRSIAAHGLVVNASRKAIVVVGRLGGKKIRIFRGAGRLATSTGNTSTLRLRNGKLKLTPAASRNIRKRLKVKQVPAATYGKLVINAKKTTTPVTPVDPCEVDPNAEGCPIVDPYLAQCGVEATSRVPGTLAPAAPLPVLSDPKPLAGTDDLAWGFKDSFRSYINFGAGGSLHALDGAGRDGMGPLAGFTFPVADGQYSANDPVDTTDDQAIINGKGTSVYCATGHGFRVVISNTTVVIDGAASRLVADVDLNLSGEWIPSQRVDLAKLDLSGITPFYNRSGSEVTWSDIPATLTASGSKAFCRPGEDGLPDQCLYSEGDELDSITVTAKTPYDLGDGKAAGLSALATYVQSELPFALNDRNVGGCELADLAGGSTSQARTIDEYLHYFNLPEPATSQPASIWTGRAAPPAPLPDLAGGKSLTGGELGWGLIRGLRSSTSGSGEFNLAEGATATSTWFGVGGTEVTKTGYNQKVGAPNASFLWPAATTAGTYSEAGGVKRLVLQAKGRVAICNTAATPQMTIAYGTVISNPTVVIDGTNSRITADVATRYRLSWVRGTVDVARFDAADATFTEDTSGGTTTVQWTLPALAETTPYGGSVTEMTAAGSAVLRMLSKDYIEGAPMDNPTITATFTE